MKRILQEINTDSIRNVLLYTQARQPIAINEDDVDNLFEAATFMALLVSHGCNLKDALEKLDPDELDCDKATKAIFVIRCSEPRQLRTDEMVDFSKYINDYFPQTEIRWGIASKMGHDDGISIMAVITH